MDISSRIIQIANELFFKWGIKSVSMDQIASDLGISKRTLYENFKDKDSLVLGVLEKIQLDHTGHLKAITAQDVPDVHKLLMMFIEGQTMKNKINPSFFKDLRKFYYPLYKDVFTKEKAASDSLILQLYTTAQQNGYFLADLDMRLVYTFIGDIMEDKLGYMSDGLMSMQEVQQNVLRPFMMGISTPRGAEAFKQCAMNMNRIKETIPNKE
ncbi:MAG: TetR/AcrR family transcriptional regulator [Bacteroidales bacterium]